MAHQLPSWHHTWAKVDQTADPAFFVRFLDATRADARTIAQANPRAFFAKLGIQEGEQILDVGCGTGDLLRAAAQLVGATGRIV